MKRFSPGELVYVKDGKPYPAIVKADDGGPQITVQYPYSETTVDRE